jgi:hypothetical protein
MCNSLKRYRNRFGLSILMVLIFSCNFSYSQAGQISAHEQLSGVSTDNLNNNIPVFFRDTTSRKTSLAPPAMLKGKEILFYDSLKVRASKKRFTKELYNAFIVNNDTIYKKRFQGTSDDYYRKFEGKKIRKIVVERLDVFGTNINYPQVDNSNKYDRILNSTHINTNEKIIRKNLLFNEGDRISPLTLSDNERLLRQLPFISDARITVADISDDEVDVVVYTKDVYSLGGEFTYRGFNRGQVSVFDKNILGLGHEFGIDMPYDANKPNSPGFGVHYTANNIRKSFIDLNAFYLNGLGVKTYGFDLSKKLISAKTKYAGGVSIHQMYTTEDLDTLVIPGPLKYNLQDYWLSRSFLVNSQSVTRIIIGGRYINNNVFERPVIYPDSYYKLQRYKIYMASAALSIQKYTKTNLIYSYGVTEDVPYGALFKITGGREINEFKNRYYLAGEASYGNKFYNLGYFYIYGGYASYFNQTSTEQGILSLKLNYFSNLLNLRNSRLRNFVQFQYIRGYGRYTDEVLRFITNNGFSGFRNDSISGTQRLHLSLESVLFSKLNLAGFKFAFFGFTDLSYLSGTNQLLGSGITLSSIGLGFRLRNDNLIFNTLQVRFSYFPNPPSLSRISNVTVSGQQLLRPTNFDPGPPAVIPYK